MYFYKDGVESFSLSIERSFRLCFMIWFERCISDSFSCSFPNLRYSQLESAIYYQKCNSIPKVSLLCLHLALYRDGSGLLILCDCVISHKICENNDRKLHLITYSIRNKKINNPSSEGLMCIWWSSSWCASFNIYWSILSLNNLIITKVVYDLVQMHFYEKFSLTIISQMRF